MSSFPDCYAIVDTETTGMRAQFSRVIDIGIIRVENGKMVKKYQALINPGSDIPPMITKITSITNADLIGAPAFDEVALEIQELLDGAVFVAHNASFDYSFIKSEFRRIGIAFQAPTMCTVALSRALYPRERRHNLDSIIERCKLKVADRHRAYPDAKAVFDFLNHVDRTLDAAEIRAAVSRLLGTGLVPKESRSLAELHDSAGVYFFYGPEQELLYVGKSKHVRTRVRSHFSPSSAGSDLLMRDETAQVHAIKTSGELSALLLEASLIKSQSPLYNRALRKRSDLVIARRVANSEGYDELKLERTAELQADPNVLAVFRTMQQAKEKLRDVAKAHRLCQKLLGIEKSHGACFGSQLGVCEGACTGIMPAKSYNDRLEEAFKLRRIKIWPYKGVVMIDERADDSSGSVFFIDNWSLKGAFKYEGELFEPLFAGAGAFDFDTYKILARFMRDPKNKRAIRIISQKEFEEQLARCQPAADEIIAIY